MKLIKPLPESWVVLNDKSDRFKETVLKYVNDTYCLNYRGDYNGWYGYFDSKTYFSIYHLDQYYNPPTKLTIDEFMSYFEQELKELPKYWIVKCTRENVHLFRETVIHYINSKTSYNWMGYSPSYYGYDGSSTCKGFNSGNSKTLFENNPVELTLEQFIELTKNEEIVDKKIIGYKTPYRIFTEDKYKSVEVGELFILSYNSGFYKPEKDVESTAYSRWIPKEIVETWEPVYEEYKVGDWITVNKVGRYYSWLDDTPQRTFKLIYIPTHFAGGLCWSTSGHGNHNTDVGYYGIPVEWFRKATPDEIEKVKEIKIDTYVLHKETSKGGEEMWKFGCFDINMSNVEFVKRFLSQGGLLRIRNTEITIELVRKIEERIKS